MGKLGTQDVEFEQWTDSIESLVAEKYSFGTEMLKWARIRGTEPISAEDLSDRGLVEDIDDDTMDHFDRDLWGLLQQQTKQVVNRQIKGSKGHGVEAWRRIFQACSPKNVGTAEALRSHGTRT